MRIVLQRVSRATLSINQKIHASINTGFLVLLGVCEGDDQSDADYLAAKLCALRVFADDHGKMNLDIGQVNGELMIVSQFTLHASTRKGNRPSFTNAAKPDEAMPLYDYFIQTCDKLTGRKNKNGVFGADMKIELVNDGPVTIIIDSRVRE